METFSIQDLAGDIRGREAKSCIYCGAEKDLTAEHVVPRGIGGNLKLPNASCIGCARTILKGFEQETIVSVLQGARLHVGVKRKNRPRNEDFIPVWGENSRKMMLPIKIAPAILFLPQFHPPGLITGFPSGGIVGSFVMRLTSHWHLDNFKITPRVVIETKKFVRFIAKIAHGYAFHSFGDSFEPVLNEIIMTENTGLPWYDFIGSNASDCPKTNDLHTLSAEWQKIGDIEYLMISIQLFARFDTPGYLVVAGRR